ncbi:response regulator [bacterium]|nr:response regulator [bacterium]
MFISDIDKIKAVLIDDTSFTRMTICRMMEQIGFQDLIEFEDGAIASQNLPLLTPPPGLIVADYHMPGLDGLELLRAVRSGQIDNIAHDTPFIMVTGEGKLESFISAIQLDVDAFLDKPTTRILLESRIRSLLGEKKR